MVDAPEAVLTTNQACGDALLVAIRDPRCNGIHAICGEKDWDDKRVTDYYAENYLRALQGLPVRRIFIMRSDAPMRDSEKRVIAEHMSSPGVEIRVIFQEDYWRLEKYSLPRGFGLALFGNTAIVHWGFDGSAPAGKVFTDPLLLQEYRSMFDELWGSGYACGRTDADKVRIRKKLRIPAHKAPSNPANTTSL